VLKTSLIGIALQCAVTSAYAQSLDYEFFKARVEPIFLQKRPGHTRCVVCHAERSNNAFRLEKLPVGGRSWTEEQSRRNYEMASRLVVPGKPDSSLLLLQRSRPSGRQSVSLRGSSSRRGTTRSGRSSPSGSGQGG